MSSDPAKDSWPVRGPSSQGPKKEKGNDDGTEYLWRFDTHGHFEVVDFSFRAKFSAVTAVTAVPPLADPRW